MLILLRDRIHASPESASARARWAWSTLGGLAGSFGLLVAVLVAAGLIKGVQQELETSADQVDAGLDLEHLEGPGSRAPRVRQNCASLCGHALAHVLT